MNSRLLILSAFLLPLLLISYSVQSATRTSAMSGNWSNTSTWTTKGIPACGDSIVIQATHTVTINTQENYTACSLPLKIVVYGELMFLNGSKLSLPCGSYVVVYPGGVIDHDVGLANSNLIDICGNVEWNSNSTLYGLTCLPASAPPCASLPIELTYFVATPCKTRQVNLSWQTATENFNDHFDIERSSDAANFNRIKTVASLAAGGNSLATLNYETTDNSPETGTNYYRLKQVDKDGAFTYSKIVYAATSSENGMQYLVIPNYNNGEFTARITGMDINQSAVVILRDGQGNILFSAICFNSGSDAEVKVKPETRLPNGNYYCSFLVNNSEHIVKVIVTDF